METKIIVPQCLCDMEAVRYMASRYATTPEKLLRRYFVQCGIVQADEEDSDDGYRLAPNEMALLSDLGVHPSKIEIE
ncbi:MAG: hypothetical protein K2M04_06355 [Muribaculaceae bacterium]|nr:hypothetical protein [Muribaculaceae bacterium]